MEDEYLKSIQLRAFDLLNYYLNERSDMISADIVKQMQEALHCDQRYAYMMLLAEYCQLNIFGSEEDKVLYYQFIDPAIHILNVEDYKNDKYYASIKINPAKFGKWELLQKKYKPFEVFVCNDIAVNPDGRQVPQIGLFTEEFTYPALLENGGIRMILTPNEIETMRQPIAEATGNVLAYGLGLGYFAFSVLQKGNVKSLTIIENSAEEIELFKKLILPQFPHADKLKIIQADAFEYAENQMEKEQFDYVFTDLWHDILEGIPLYKKMKTYENLAPNAKFSYRAEKSIQCYIERVEE